MIRVAVTNQKGGSAKTTAAVNVAAALAEKGRRVLVLDLDPQASASAWLGVPDGGTALRDVLLDRAPMADAVRATAIKGLDLVPSSAWLLAAERNLAGEAGAETVLRLALDRLAPDRWDVAIMDCPPSLGLLSVLALVAARTVVAPVEASTLALAGLAALVRTVETVRERLNPALTLGAILVCRTDTRTNLARDVEAELRRRFGAAVLRQTIREAVRMREAPSFSKPITVYAPGSGVAADFRAAAAELWKRWRAN